MNATPSAALLSVCLLCLMPPADAAIELARGIHLLPGRFVPGTQPDGNTVVLRAPDGLIVVDSGRHLAHTQAIIDFSRTEKSPVRAVVNTHWHLDHVGGNALLRRTFPQLRVYASGALEAARSGFLADYRRYLSAEIERKAGDPAAQQPLRAELALIDAGPLLAPDEVIAGSGSRALAGRMLELHLETGAVTAGDIWLFDPATRILVAGDLVTLPVPFLDTACPQRWQHVLDRLADTDFETLVPGHGAPMKRPQFEAYRRAYGRLLACAASDQAKGVCIDTWIADLGPLLSDDEQAFTRTLLDYYVDQHLRIAPDRAARQCAA